MFHPAELPRRISLKSWGKPKEKRKTRGTAGTATCIFFEAHFCRFFSLLHIFNGCINLVKTTCQLKVFHYEKFFQWNGGGSAIALLSTLLFIEFQAKQYNPAT